MNVEKLYVPGGREYLTTGLVPGEGGIALTSRSSLLVTNPPELNGHKDFDQGMVGKSFLHEICMICYKWSIVIQDAPTVGQEPRGLRRGPHNTSSAFEASA